MTWPSVFGAGVRVGSSPAKGLVLQGPVASLHAGLDALRGSVVTVRVGHGGVLVGSFLQSLGCNSVGI